MDTRRVSGEVKARLPGERRFQRRGGREGGSELASETRNKGVVETSLPDNIFRGILSPSRGIQCKPGQRRRCCSRLGGKFRQAKKMPTFNSTREGRSLGGKYGPHDCQLGSMSESVSRARLTNFPDKYLPNSFFNIYFISFFSFLLSFFFSSFVRIQMDVGPRVSFALCFYVCSSIR